MKSQLKTLCFLLVMDGLGFWIRQHYFWPAWQSYLTASLNAIQNFWRRQIIQLQRSSLQASIPLHQTNNQRSQYSQEEARDKSFKKEYSLFLPLWLELWIICFVWSLFAEHINNISDKFEEAKGELMFREKWEDEIHFLPTSWFNKKEELRITMEDRLFRRLFSVKLGLQNW